MNQTPVRKSNSSDFLNDKKKYSWPHVLDFALAIFVSLVMFALVYEAAKLVNPVILDHQASNIWFEADIPRVFENMSDRFADNYRTRVHPIFSLVALSLVNAVKSIFQTGSFTAVRLVATGVAAVWMSTLYFLLRSIGCRRFDSVIFCLISTLSAASIFWFTVPETYAFGSFSMLAALLLVAMSEKFSYAPKWYILLSASTLSITVTNWMVGLLMVFVRFTKRQAILLSIQALGLVSLFWVIQKKLFPRTNWMFDIRGEERYISLEANGGPIRAIQSFFSHTIVMPDINIVTGKYDPSSEWPIFSTQLSAPGSASAWGVLAVVIWMSLLGLGIWGIFSSRSYLRFKVVLLATLAGQLLLHCLYGDETFLYSLHFLPLLILLAAFSTLTKARLLALALAIFLIPAIGINNISQFNTAISIVDEQAPQRHQVLKQMSRRPRDPWPRGEGHVVLAIPGSAEEDKAYHEPGGSFSPAVGSFGLSIWLRNPEGRLEATSDSLDLDALEQKFGWSNNSLGLPAIETDNGYYHSKWSIDSEKQSLLDLNISEKLNSWSPELVIRSVGPAGGPIKQLTWDGKKLNINKRWIVKFDQAPNLISLGEEGTKGWMNGTSQNTTWQDEDGWGYARFSLSSSRHWQISIEDTQESRDSNKTLSFIDTVSPAKAMLPDERFSDCLQAQVANLLMGLVGRQTRPGEPTNYPLAWQRDGSYTVVALARAGKLKEAEELSHYFAENDFFGGFGSEADAPGLSLWALKEVAVRLKDEEYKNYIWPHVRRKADFVLEMLETKDSIHKEYSGPVVPKYVGHDELTLVADPPSDGLISGRMDWHRPKMFVNAVSYRGLLDAAFIANELGHIEEADRWENTAAELQKSWELAFQHADAKSENERTYISALWNTWIGANQKDLLTNRLTDRWKDNFDASGNIKVTPLWTYFNIAHAHQWVFLGHPEHVWQSLNWFLDNQASEGLYTWWEGNGEENSFGLWQDIRGWVQPPHVTPHYWSAAEMLLLQLDMLAYTDISQEKTTVVLGAGIPRQWLNKSMAAEGLSLENGTLSWKWDGRSRMHVQILGDKMPVTLGPSFPRNASVEIEYL